MTIEGLILAHIRKNPLRMLLTAGSVALALFLFCSLQAVTGSLNAVVNGTGGNRMITSSAVSLFQSLPLSMVQKVRAARVPGLVDIGHWTWFDGVFRGDPAEFFARFAVDVPVFREQYGDRADDGEEYLLSAEDWDRFEQEKASCIVGRGLADRYGLRVGESLELEGTIYPGSYQFEIVAIYASGNPTYDEETLYFHWDYLNEAMGRPDEVGLFTLRIEAGSDTVAVAQAIDDLFENSSSRTLTQPEAAFQAQFLSMWGNVGLLFDFIGGAVLFATFMIALNTMLLSVNERVREIAVLKTLGFRSGSLARLYLLESLVICGGGAVLGTGLARLLWHGQPIRLATVIFPEFAIPDDAMVLAVAIGALLALIAGAAPALIAARVPIVSALR